MTKAKQQITSRTQRKGQSGSAIPRMTQPCWMKSGTFVSGIHKLKGQDAWALYKVAAAGDRKRARALLERDPRLVNVEIWYTFPIHFAVWAGDVEMVKLLLKHNADAGQSTFLCGSWHQLLAAARTRGYHEIQSILEQQMEKRFNYSAEFEQLRRAIETRDARRVMSTVKRHPQLVTAADELGNNALHHCVRTRQLKLIEKFIELGTPLDAKRADGATPLLMALSWFRPFPPAEAIRNRWVVVGTLLAHGAKYNLSVAAAVGDQERIQQLLKKDKSLACQLDSARTSPLSFAAREGHTHLVRILLDNGADPNMPEIGAPQGAALFYACWGNHLETVKLLLENGADPNAGLDSSGCCLTIGKHYHGNRAEPVRKLLREFGADDPPYDMNAKQLMQAIQNGDPVLQHEEFLGNVMNKRRADLLELYLDSDDTIPQRMHYWSGIVYPESTSLVSMLLERGLDVNQPDWMGSTYLHASASALDSPIATLFLAAGAYVNARDLQFKGTALAAAVRTMPEDPQQHRESFERRRMKMIRLLLRNGAATNLPGDEHWATPLAWAKKNGLTEVADYLVQQGAES